ncbi:MAG TPA: UDP-3-O-(3-hydroxymyristoyl)glucosamine N-acyltransferase [Candidatus Paceibacterota bacterium]|nr:UDP-3-O-(3-hydroxymyristoyl)glucosamine N-acyltransferase [Verrucomicrobiota bacterium]HRY49426.1 UDP-3-O-(3-hydroxymyristoyl)glucosamine N-acyltransferase [Candidatus Paceibacterota bacterium]
MSERSLEELARHVGGRIVGDAGARISSVAGLAQAGKGQISFLANRRYAKLLASTQASAVIVGAAVDCSVTQLIVENPHYAYMRVVELLHGHRRHKLSGISPRASVDPTATIGDQTHIHDFATISEKVRIGSRCVIYPGVFIGAEAEIGDDCILYPNVAVYDGVHIGHRVIIDANSSVGQDGFGYATHKGVHHKIPHLGRVRIEDDVGIGTNCSIQSGALNDTRIGRGTKIGDGAVIGHGVQIGVGCLIVSQVGIAGSTTLGNYCVLAGQVGVSGHLKVGDRVSVGAQSGVANDVEPDTKIFGSPAFELKQALQAYALVKSLPEFRKTLKKLEQRLAQLEQQP